ncbi:MAG: glycosyltransferase domain-containing protein [Patescibacteria group bacterium]
MVKKKNNSNSIVIYTAIFGDKDDLIEPDFKVEGCDFVCFTDNPNLKSDFFEVRRLKPEFEDPTLNARKCKLLSTYYLPDYKYSVWIDGNLKLKKDNIKQLIEQYLAKDDIALFRHPERDCVYEEAEACIYYNKEDPSRIRKQVDCYRKKGYPKKNGLVMTSILFRKNQSKKIKKLNEEWWRELRKRSKRDQLSFNYVAWKNKLEFYEIKGNAYGNDLYERVGHKIKESIADYHQALEIKNRRINELEEYSRKLERELNVSLPVLAFLRAKKRILKIRDFSFSSCRELFNKAWKVFKKHGLSGFLKYAFVFLKRGRGHFENKKIT